MATRATKTPAGTPPPKASRARTVKPASSVSPSLESASDAPKTSASDAPKTTVAAMPALRRVVGVLAGTPELATPVEPREKAARPVASLTDDEIRGRAYQHFVARGGNHGDDWGDWLLAEQELLKK